MTTEITPATSAAALHPNPAAITNPVAWIIGFGSMVSITPVSLVSETRTQVRVASKSGCDYTFRKNRVAPKSVDFRDPRIKVSIDPTKGVQTNITANSLYASTSHFRGRYLCFHEDLVNGLQKRLQEQRKATHARDAIAKLEEAKTALVEVLGPNAKMVADIEDNLITLRNLEKALREG